MDTPRKAKRRRELREDIKRRRDALRLRLAGQQAPKIQKTLEKWDSNDVYNFVSSMGSKWQQVATQMKKDDIDGETLAGTDLQQLKSTGLPADMACKLFTRIKSIPRAEGDGESDEASSQDLLNEIDQNLAMIDPQNTTDLSALEDLREQAQKLRQSATLYTYGQSNIQYEKSEIERVAAEHKVAGLLEDKSESISSDLEPEIRDISALSRQTQTPAQKAFQKAARRLNRSRSRSIATSTSKLAAASTPKKETYLDNATDTLTMITDPYHNITKWAPIRSIRQLPWPEGCRRLTPSDLSHGFTKPTPIQAWCWSVTLTLPLVQQQQRSRRRDLIATAETGSGKTLAYLLPMLHHLLEETRTAANDDDGAFDGSMVFKKTKLKGFHSLLNDAVRLGNCTPKAVVVVPTRELALQIFEVARGLFLSNEKIPGILIGGSGIRKQISTLQQLGAHAIIATPGRVLDVMKNYTGLILKKTDFLVLDEADRLLSMGFSEEVLEVIQYLAPSRQNLLFSATWPMSLDDFSLKILVEPIRIAIRRHHLLRTPEPAKGIEQIIKVCSPEGRAMLFLEVLREAYSPKDAKVLVFTKTKKAAEYLRELLEINEYQCYAMHGDLSQEERVSNLDSYKSKRNAILIATDVAARGIDVQGISAVINYEMPQNIEQYIHRIGRTGRAGHRGLAYSLFTEQDMMISEKLITVLRGAFAAVPPELSKICEKSAKIRKDRIKRHKLKMKNKALQKAVEAGRKNSA